MLTVRLARNGAEVEAAQRLRYRVFYEELGARPDAIAQVTRRDQDRFDAACDHMLVIHQATPSLPGAIIAGGGQLVGTYRLLSQERTAQSAGFYSQSEFDIAPLLATKQHLEFVELGRSCVLKSYRTRPVIELLWQGIWDYVRTRKLDVMLGCASLPGTCLESLAASLSFLAHNHAAPDDWRVCAHARRYVPMTRLPRGSYDGKQALKALPPLIKGYLRVGAFVGDGAVIDNQFNTTDVLIVLPVSNIKPRYFNHFGPANHPVPPANSTGRHNQPLMS